MAAPANPDYVDIFEPIGGWNSKLMVWDFELNGYVPWMTGVNNTVGKGDRAGAIAEAKSWAEAEGIEYKGPEE